MPISVFQQCTDLICHAGSVILPSCCLCHLPGDSLHCPVIKVLCPAKSQDASASVALLQCTCQHVAYCLDSKTHLNALNNDLGLLLLLRVQMLPGDQYALA